MTSERRDRIDPPPHRQDDPPHTYAVFVPELGWCEQTSHSYESPADVIARLELLERRSHGERG